LSIVVSDDAASVTGSTRAVRRWLGAFSGVKTKRNSRDDDLHRMESV